jgi:tetratricopeptide (TPR) repeat protein
VQAFNAGQSDSAISYFRQANVIYSGEPAGHSAIATLFANAGQVDSAAHYYGRAAQAAMVDTVKYAKERREALYNQGAVLHQAKRWDEALVTFRSYLAAYPNDPQAMAGVASAYAAKGNNDSATAMYLKILDRADSVAPEQLFTAGVAIFNSAPPLPDTATAGNACRTEERAKRPPPTPRQVTTRCNEKTREMVRARDEASAGTYRLAIRAFDAGLARNPYYRDALFNLCNTYLILQDSLNMLSAAQRLVAVDPMGRGSLRLLAAAWQFKRNSDSTLRYLTIADSILPVEVSVTSFAPQDQNAALQGLVTNFHDRPSAPLKLTVEFVDAKGAVVASQTVDVAAIEPGSSQVFQTSAIGAGIVAWRYKQG